MLNPKLQYDINLREELKDLMRENSYEVLIQRTSKKVRCKCFNEKYNEPDSKCPICLGTGWLFKFDKCKAFNQDIRAAVGNALINTDIGVRINENKTFVVEHDVDMSVGDYIWEVTWREGKPISLLSLFKIEAISENRGSSGRIEFKTIIAKKETIDKDFKNMYIGKAWRDVNE